MVALRTFFVLLLLAGLPKPTQGQSDKHAEAAYTFIRQVFPVTDSIALIVEPLENEAVEAFKQMAPLLRWKGTHIDDVAPADSTLGLPSFDALNRIWCKRGEIAHLRRQQKRLLRTCRSWSAARLGPGYYSIRRTTVDSLQQHTEENEPEKHWVARFGVMNCQSIALSYPLFTRNGAFAFVKVERRCCHLNCWELNSYIFYWNGSKWVMAFVFQIVS